VRIVQTSPKVQSICLRSVCNSTESSLAVLIDGAGAVGGGFGVGRLGWACWLGSRGGGGSIVAGGKASEALREGAGASGVDSVEGELVGALVRGGDGWHRSMIGDAASGGLDGFVGEGGLGLVGRAGALGGLLNHGRVGRP
jgi:hypothetical protein